MTKRLTRREFIKYDGSVVFASAISGRLNARTSDESGASDQGRTAATGNEPTSPPCTIRINMNEVVHKMAGGAGASWHAMGPTAYWYKDLLPGKMNRNSRGSGWGGNPPLEYAEAWNDLRHHARWLGLNFVRVEISMRMYEPEAGRFDWQNDEMRTLYRILDYCQESGVDVFFTQMWADVRWNAFEGAGRLQSAPKSVAAFSHGLATLMDLLVKRKGYTCIRWLCIVNEPGASWSWWQGEDGRPVSVMPALHAVRSELDKRGIGVALSGPDWDSLGHNSPDFDFNDRVVGALDAHNYAFFPDVGLQKLWADKAHALGIPFFQSEFGTWTGENPFENPCSTSPRSYPNQLTDAEKVIGGIRVGVDGFNRWSFVNRGDLDGQWQLVRTFETTHWDYFKRVVPEPVPYFCYGILTRFMPKYSSVFRTEADSTDFVVTAFRSPKGNLTVYVLNKSNANRPIVLSFEGLSTVLNLYKYQVSQGSVENSKFKMDPLAMYTASNASPQVADTLPFDSITTYSTYKLAHSDPGIIGD